MHKDREKREREKEREREREKEREREERETEKEKRERQRCRHNKRGRKSGNKNTFIFSHNKIREKEEMMSYRDKELKKNSEAGEFLEYYSYYEQ